MVPELPGLYSVTREDIATMQDEAKCRLHPDLTDLSPELLVLVALMDEFLELAEKEAGRDGKWEYMKRVLEEALKDPEVRSLAKSLAVRR